MNNVYHKNKLCYITLKNLIQVGGKHLNNTEDITEFEMNDTYTFTHNNIDYVFTITDSNILDKKWKLQTNVDTTKGSCSIGATLVVHIEIQNDISVGKLNYIRTNKDVEGHNFVKLFNVFKCLMKRLKVNVIKLDEDSKFYNEKCTNSYSALMYRAFDGKLSLYLTEEDLKTGTNFQPNYNVVYDRRNKCITDADQYINAIKRLSESTYGDWKKYVEIIKDIYKSDLENERMPVMSDDKKFIEFIREYVNPASKDPKDKNYIIVDKLLNNITGISGGKIRGKYSVYDAYDPNDYKSKLYDLPRELFKTTEYLKSNYDSYTC